MDYKKLFDQLYQELMETPDFPAAKVAKLWRSLPPCSRDLSGMIYLLPFGASAKEEQISHAKILNLLTLSAFTHGDLEKNETFTDGEAVLYGDYLFALAFSLLPSSVSAEDAHKLLKTAFRFGEHRQKHYHKETNEEKLLCFAKEDYGIHLREIAEKAISAGEFDEQAKNDYIYCAENIGTAWGILCENYAVRALPLLEKAQAFTEKLPMKESLFHLIRELKGAAIVHDQNLAENQ